MLRDAVLVNAPGDDPGPAGSVVLAFKKLAMQKRTTGSKILEDLIDLIELPREGMTDIADRFDDALQSGRPAPSAVTELVANICAARPDAEVLAWWLADRLQAETSIATTSRSFRYSSHTAARKMNRPLADAHRPDTR